MIRQTKLTQRYSYLTLFLLVNLLQFLPLSSVIQQSDAQTPNTTPSACAATTTPLTAEEQTYARTAWQYFVKNYQNSTGFVNSTTGYPSGTLWDQASYLMALNSARWLNVINQQDFDTRLNKFLTTLGNLPLFENSLPNKVYNTVTLKMTDYSNNPKERGIGWSALDIGRMLVGLHIIQSCHPQYQQQIANIVSRWQLGRVVRNGRLYGAIVQANNQTLLVQEGRLGYEEYAARGYQLWGLQPNNAIALEPFEFIKSYNLNIPVDLRNYQTTNASNYVVSESYILDGIEFGLQGYLKEYAASVLEAQKRHYEATKELTAVSEDHIDKAPYFLYNSVYANGVPWATITDENQPYPQLRTLSTKTAFGWRYLYPKDSYAQKIFEVAKKLRSADGNGFYAGQYLTTKQPNKIATSKSNGLILEILYYKARGDRALIASDRVSFAPAPPTGNKLTGNVSSKVD
jgi:hypothetical protein